MDSMAKELDAFSKNKDQVDYDEIIKTIKEDDMIDALNQVLEGDLYNYDYADIDTELSTLWTESIISDEAFRQLIAYAKILTGEV